MSRNGMGEQSADYDAGWICPSCGNDPSDDTLHMEGCRVSTLTSQDWADLVEAIRPPTAWADYGKRVTHRLLDAEDAAFAMETLAPVVARIVEHNVALATRPILPGSSDAGDPSCR